jgi:membrane-bound lytic murein transglycosylase A
MSLSSQFRSCVRQQLTAAALAILGALAGCSSAHLPDTAEPPAARSATPAAAPAVPERERATLQRERARWVAADWSELPG